MTKQSRTTYIDTQKLRELVDNSELSKKEIIRETGITDKTFQRALSLSKKHTINKDAVSKLAEFFKLNYEDLIDKEKEKNLSDIDRTILDRIWDARQLLNLKGHKYIKKNYHINLNQNISGSIKKIVEFTFSKDLLIAQNNRGSNQNIKANIENELKYID